MDTTKPTHIKVEIDAEGQGFVLKCEADYAKPKKRIETAATEPIPYVKAVGRLMLFLAAIKSETKKRGKSNG